MENQYNLRNPAVKRLMKEAQELHKPTELFFAQPLEDDLFEWHFTIRGPEGTEFENGIYHGKIVLPPEYPMKPPSIILFTPNGRFENFKKICLSISGHHPESWQPSWSIRTALLAIIGFMPTHGNGAIGSLDYSHEERKKLAKLSNDWECPECGQINKFLKPLTEASSTGAAEAKELAKQINFQADGANQTPSNEKTSENPEIDESSNTVPNSTEPVTSSDMQNCSNPSVSNDVNINPCSSNHLASNGINQPFPMMSPPPIPHPLFTMMMMQAQYNAAIQSQPGYMSGSPLFQNLPNSCFSNSSDFNLANSSTSSNMNMPNSVITSSDPIPHSSRVQTPSSESNCISADKIDSSCASVSNDNLTSELNEKVIATNSPIKTISDVTNDVEESISCESASSLETDTLSSPELIQSSTIPSDILHNDTGIDSSSHLRRRHVQNDEPESHTLAEIPINNNRHNSQISNTDIVIIALVLCIVFLLFRRFVYDNVLKLYF